MNSTAQPPRRTTWWLKAGIAAAFAGLVIFSSVMLQQVQRQKDQSAELALKVMQLEHQLATASPASSLLQVNRVAELGPVSSGLEARGMATILGNGDNEQLILQAEGLPELKQDEVFRVWLLKDNEAVDIGAFLTLNGSGALYYPFPPDQFEAIVITLEPDGDALEPRGETILQAPIP